MTMSEAPEVIFSKRGAVGHILLNRPKALNALTHNMVLEMTRQLRAWEHDDAIKCVVIEGEGEKAFCAGGDIRALYNSGKEGTPYALDFYHDEYRLNALIKHYKKPYVAILDAITMGGGVGVSVHGSHRVVTDRTVFAMPETGIGLFPDVGGSFFLPRLPGKIGLYLALTGARIKAGDCIFAGIGTHYIADDMLTKIVPELADASYGKDAFATVEAMLMHHATSAPPATLSEHRQAIDRAFGRKSVEAIIEALEKKGTEWAAKTIETLRGKSPTSLKLTFRQLHEGLHKDFDECMRMEYRMVHGIVAGHDFYEGVRAIIIDKDNAPKWRPATLEEVTDEEIDAYFQQDGKRELALGH
jgi:enoyl-CoA hydratase